MTSLKKSIVSCFAFLLCLCAVVVGGDTREMAVTFDDLPVVRAANAEAAKDITTRLLQTITSEKLPVVGFVNESKMERDGKLDPEMVAVLKMWVDADLELGNHTYSHMDLHHNPPEAFEQDVIHGETTTRSLLKQKGKELRYFRYPYLHTGRDLETKNKVAEFLASRGYTNAPVTIDNAEWIFALAYEQSDGDLRAKIVESYISYMSDKIAFYEKESRLLLGRNMHHILLLHANQLNAAHLPGLLQVIRAKGYTFISLEEALKDEAYGLPDNFTGAGGITWLHRWAITRGEKKEFFQGEPVVPPFVMQAAGVTEE
jgi:peptidoglycan/xylan/chitin deacetylase (PgdA/CDA1 family)